MNKKNRNDQPAYPWPRLLLHPSHQLLSPSPQQLLLLW